MTGKAVCLFFCALSCNCFANESPEALQEAFMAGARANDADAIADCYSADAVSYDIGTRVLHGPDAVRESWAGFFSQFRIIAIDLENTHMEKRDDLAVAWGEFTLQAEPLGGGEPMLMQGRFTDVAENFNGHWLYTMDHASLPLPPPPEDQGAP
jgi:ketosteroid isomerase-like protein